MLVLLYYCTIIHVCMVKLCIKLVSFFFSFVIFLYERIHAKVLLYVQSPSLLLRWVFYCVAKLARLLMQLNNLLRYFWCLLLVKDACHVSNAYS